MFVVEKENGTGELYDSKFIDDFVDNNITNYMFDTKILGFDL